MIVIGLGNPGTEYTGTRHNIGFRVVDALSERTGIPLKKQFLRPLKIGKGFYRGKSLFLVKPLTYMNRSGDIIPWLLAYTAAEPQDLLVVADHLDLPPGCLRLRPSGSSGGQKGLQSIISVLGSGMFSRLMVGIGRPEDGSSIPDYVLGEPDAAEAALLNPVVTEAADQILRLLEEPIHRVMNDVNRRKTE
ncbi:MAG: aminoacyl-tRNA hydrolase [Spirochaetales bacterium]|nr:aminoacyl-tRNA hydrolase [Spirochaetales bacterium]